MDRLERPDEGFTLLELVIAIALSAVVLLSASNLLIHFGKFSANVIKAETSLMGTALGTFEEIVGKINVANSVDFNGSSEISMCVDTLIDDGVNPPHFTPSIFTDDTCYGYWLDGTQLKYKSTGAIITPIRVIAEDISLLSFTKIDENRIQIILETQAASGPLNQKSKEHLETTAVMRSRSAS